MKKIFTLLAVALMGVSASYAAYATNPYTIEFNDGGSSLTQVTSTGAITKYVTAESANYIESFEPISGNTYTRCYLKNTWTGLSVGYGSYDGGLTVNLSEKGQAKAASVTVKGKGTIYLKFYGTSSSDMGTELEFDCESFDKGVTVNFTTTMGSATTKNIKYFEVTSDGVGYVKSITVNYNYTAVELDEESTTGYTTKWSSSKTYDITCNRTITAGQWNTFMVPFPMTSFEVKTAFGETAKVMKMASIENDVVNFEEATTVERGEAYLVNPDDDVKSFKVNCVNGMTSTVYNNAATKTFGDDWAVKSSFLQAAVDGTPGNITVLSHSSADGKDKFYTLGDEQTMKGFRWYIQNKGNQARKLSLNLGGETTGINEVEGLNGSNSLNGSNGKFIQNGRMVIVKAGKKFNVNGQEVK